MKTGKTYKQIFVEGVNDLPKEEGYYPVHQKGFEPDYYISMRWTGLKNSLWEQAYDYYLIEQPEPAQLTEEMISAKLDECKFETSKERENAYDLIDWTRSRLFKQHESTSD